MKRPRFSASSFEDADGASVLADLESLLQRWAASSLVWVLLNFRPSLKFTGRTDLVEAVGLAGVRRSHRILNDHFARRRGQVSRPRFASKFSHTSRPRPTATKLRS